MILSSAPFVTVKQYIITRTFACCCLYSPKTF